MSFRKQLTPKPAPTVREMVTLYGDRWYLFCASHPISSAVFEGERTHDRLDALLMKQCEQGERDRVDEYALRYANEREPVQVEHVYPPIPDRSCDYAAYRDPDPGNPVGRGPTAFAAINDLIEQESER